MQIYLSSRFPRAAEMRKYQRGLEGFGHTVVSTWHDNEEDDETLSPTLMNVWAERDLIEIENVDVFLAFTEQPESKASTNGSARGGRHAEFGFALGTARYICIIGPREHVLHNADGVMQYATVGDAVSDRFGEKEGEEEDA